MLTTTRAATSVATARHWMREDAVAGMRGGFLPAARPAIAPLSATVPGTTVSAPVTVFASDTEVVGSPAWSPPV